MNLELKEFRAGFVAILGRPNSGKSTLLNKILANKLAITTAKPQTTRNKINGILNNSQGQMILVDTPGLIFRNDPMSNHYLATLQQAAADADLILLIDDVTRPFAGKENQLLAKLLKQQDKQLMIAINKIDAVEKKALEIRRKELTLAFNQQSVYQISALKGEGIKLLKNSLFSALPIHPPYYAEDQLSDLPEKFFAAETIREKAFLLLSEELPYSLAVVINSFKEGEKIIIAADLVVEKKSQKGMVIGKGGQMIKEIGIKSRKELEKIYQKQVVLKLAVKVSPNWSKNRQKRKEFGYQ